MEKPISLERVPIAPADSPPIRRAERWEFVVIAAGRAELFAAGRARTLQAGFGAVFLPGEARALGGDRRADAVAVVLSFGEGWAAAPHRLPLIESLAARPAADRAERDLGSDLLASLDRKERTAREAEAESGLGEAVLESLFLDLALEFLRTDEERRAGRAPAWLRRACAAMERGKNLRRGGSRLAELAGKSPEHVIRQMRRYYDKTPTQFVNELRLRRATELLALSEKPVLDISYSLGFENPSYFSQLFKERYGMPPSRFRAGRRG